VSIIFFNIKKGFRFWILRKLNERDLRTENLNYIKLEKHLGLNYYGENHEEHHEENHEVSRAD